MAKSPEEREALKAQRKAEQARLAAEAANPKQAEPSANADAQGAPQPAAAPPAASSAQGPEAPAVSSAPAVAQAAAATAPKAASAAAAPAAGPPGTVLVHVPRPFNLALSHTNVVRVGKGNQHLKVEIADHPYAKHQGVKRLS